MVGKFASSKVAAACIYNTRKCCRFEQVWPSAMEDLTGYTRSNMKDILKIFDK